jgi:chitinase
MKCCKVLVPLCMTFTCFVACLILLSAVTTSATAQEAAAKPILTKRLIGDYGYWSRTQTPPYSSEQIPFDKLTDINHAGVNCDASGNLIVPSGFLEPELIEKARNHGVRVMLLLGGDFSDMETTPGGLNALLKNVQTFIQRYGYDGVDIDWEYPSTPADATFFRSLLLGLRSVLLSPRYIISADVPPWGGTGYDYPDAKEIVDYFNIMTYDCAGPWTDSAQLNSAIFPDPNNPEPWDCEPGGSVKEAIDIFEGLNIPRAKLNVGTPFYGYVYHQVNALWGYCPNQDCSNSVDYENYGTFFKPRINQKGWRTFYDPFALVPYMLRADGSDGYITYDDGASTFYRVWYTDWARDLGGTFIWELDADYDGSTQDLLDAAFNASLPQTE